MDSKTEMPPGYSVMAYETLSDRVAYKVFAPEHEASIAKFTFPKNLVRDMSPERWFGFVQSIVKEICQMDASRRSEAVDPAPEPPADAPEDLAPLPFSDPTDWHWRWQLSHTGSGVLHRVEMYTKIWGREGDPLNDGESDLAIRGCDALTVCGRYMHMYMPGLFGRTGNPRCKRCCKLLGIPEGDGAPFNEDIDA